MSGVVSMVLGLFWIIVVIVLLVILTSCIRIVKQAQALVIERLGAYQTTWGTGLHFKMPVIDRVARKVDLKEQVVDFAPQPVITKDAPPQRKESGAAVFPAEDQGGPDGGGPRGFPGVCGQSSGGGSHGYFPG